MLGVLTIETINKNKKLDKSHKKYYERSEVRKFVHDLRNVTSKLNGYILLRLSTNSRGKKAFYMRKIREKAEELEDLIDSFK